MDKQNIEHQELWASLKKARTEMKRKEIRKKIAEIYYPLVEKIAKKMERKLRNITAEELSSYGVDGLMSAIDRFSPEIGVVFPCFANLRIQGSMVDNIRKDDIIPRSVRANFNKIEKIRESLIIKNGRDVSIKEVLDEAKIDFEYYNINIKKFIPTSFMSLDGTDVVSDDKRDDFKKDVNDIMSDPKSTSPESKMLRVEFFGKLTSSGFSRDEQKIIYYYYYEELTMEDIAKKLNMCESRVSQIHSEVLPRLKQKIINNPSYFGSDIKNIIESCNDTSPLF